MKVFYMITSTISWLLFIFVLILSTLKHREDLMLYALLFYMMYMKQDLEGKIED